MSSGSDLIITLMADQVMTFFSQNERQSTNPMVIYIYGCHQLRSGKNISLIVESDGDIAADDCETINP
jgi:hypothetical protein